MPAGFIEDEYRSPPPGQCGGRATRAQLTALPDQWRRLGNTAQDGGTTTDDVVEIRIGQRPYVDLREFEFHFFHLLLFIWGTGGRNRMVAQPTRKSRSRRIDYRVSAKASRIEASQHSSGRNMILQRIRCFTSEPPLCPLPSRYIAVPLERKASTVSVGRRSR